MTAPHILTNLHLAVGASAIATWTYVFSLFA